MKCPVCHQEVQEGYIPTNRPPLYFVPNDGGTRGLSVFSYGQNTIPLTRVPRFRCEKAEGFYCPNCKIVVLPVKDIVPK